MADTHATVVLVPGAWHGPWCWQSVTPYLSAQGYAVELPELPSVTSLEPAGLVEDAAHLTALLSRIAGPVILCGHSYGGMVISAADTGRCDIQRLVYVCAYMTEAGESLESSLRAAGERRPGHWIRRDGAGRTWVDAQRAADLFYYDCPNATRSWATAQLRPQWGKSLSQICEFPAWRRHRSMYVIGSADQALAPDIQRAVYGPRARDVVTLASGHSPFLSQPLQLAQVLAGLAQ